MRESDETVPARRSDRRLLAAGLGLALLCVVLALPQLHRFGPSWDLVNAEYDYGEQYLAFLLSGDPAYTDFHAERDEAGALPAPAREPHPDFRVVRAPPETVYPLGATLSALACHLLWTRSALLPAMAAHHVPVVLFLAALLAVTLVWGTRRAGWAAGVGAVAAIVVSPRLFQDGFWNLKDFPEACLYSFTWLAVLWAAGLTDRQRAPSESPRAAPARTGRWIVVAVLTALALAQKGNALMLPVQALLLWVLIAGLQRMRRQPPLVLPWRAVLIAAPVFVAVYVAVNPYFWHDGVQRLTAHLAFLQRMSQVVGRDDVLLAARHVLWTTPPVVLLAAAVGLFHRRVSAELRVALALGVAFPIARALLPSARVHDGVRLFLEFAPPLCLLAGFGFAVLVDGLVRAMSRGRRAVIAVLAGLAVFGPAVHAASQVWPYGHCYYNAVAGGLSGARAAGLADAHDYWGLSYWAGMDWLSQHAAPGAAVLVPIADHVVAAAAPVRLRADLHLVGLDDPPPRAPLYVMAITRGGPHFALLEELAAGPPPAHTLSVQGAPILHIVRIDDDARAARLAALWVAARRDPLRALKPLLLWLTSQEPAVIQRVQALLAEAPARGVPEVVSELRTLVPPELAPALDEWLAGDAPER